MAVAMLLEWPGQTQEQYEQLMKLVGWKPIRPRVDSSTSPAPCPGDGGWWTYGSRRKHSSGSPVSDPFPRCNRLGSRTCLTPSSIP
jgi:hypothetical protein